MNYIIVVYDYSGEPLRRIPENDLEVAKTVAEYFTDCLYVIRFIYLAHGKRVRPDCRF